MTGNAIVGQSGGPTSVINASLCGIAHAVRSFRGIGTLYGMRWGIEGLLGRAITDLSAEDPRVIDGLRSTPSSALGSCRYKLSDADLPRILEILRDLDIRFFFLIGGNDTMDTINRLERYCRSRGYGLAGIGVPKTVDNDLFGTDHTPGYGSAARYVALSVQQAGRLARDMQRVDKFVVHQTVGRNVGWLAAAAALGKRSAQDAPHLIYVPERPVTREGVVADVRRCVQEYGWASIVCGEGIVWEDGIPVSASRTQDRFANVEFGAMGGTSAAIALHRLITEETGFRGEFQITESLAMCAADRASEVDREEAYQCGRHAVTLAEQGQTGVMVAIRRESGSPYGVSYGTIPLAEVAARAKPMPAAYIAPTGNAVTAAYLDYARPLAGSLAPYAELRNMTVGSKEQ